MLSEEDKKFLELYSDSIYEKPSVTVDSVIFRIKSEDSKNYRKLPEKKLQVFLTKRNYSPYKNNFAIIGTFVDLKYELMDTMKLCVKNKIGLEKFYFEQLFTFGDKSRDPRTRVLSVSYLLLTNNDVELKNGEWFDVLLTENESNLNHTENGYTLVKKYNITLSNNNTILKNTIEIKNEKIGLTEKKDVKILETSLAFDHIKIIYYALERLKNKLEYTDIIFNMLPKEFTLTELKQCYELILREHLLDANFRRKISKMVFPINKYDEAKGHRTSQLFIHNPNWISVDLD